MPYHYIWLFPLGILIGAFGTLIGAGGGFILVPILLLLYPNENTELITSISLAVVFFNALSGSWAYSRMKRVDYKSGIIFAIATIPGAILGAVSTAYVPRYTFDLIFGVLMIVAGVFLWISAKDDHAHAPVPSSPHPSVKKPVRWTVRDFVDRDGVHYHYEYNPVIGIVLSIFVGFVSSLLGVGGGFIHVPALSRLLNFPVHIATATSHFVLVCTRHSAYGDPRRRRLARRPNRRAFVESRRRQVDYSRPGARFGFRRHPSDLVGAMKKPIPHSR